MRNPEEPVYCPLCGEPLDHVESDNEGNGSYSVWYNIDCECGACGEVAVEIDPEVRKQRLKEEAWHAKQAEVRKQRRSRRSALKRERTK